MMRRETYRAKVRAVCALESGLICSGSRDASVRVWAPAEGNTFKQDKVLYGHEHWVASLLALPRSDLHPRGSVVSGTVIGRVSRSCPR